MISSITRVGDMSVSSRSRSTAAMKPAERNCRADTLTLKYGARPLAPAVHSLAAPTPVASTHSPITVMRPDSSATSMNSFGDSRPRVG